MQTYVAPVLFTLFLWWFSTGIILHLDGLPQRTFKWTMVGATLVAACGFVGLVVSSKFTTPASAYCAFTCALLIWAWQEVAFLLGLVTGPRRVACPPGTTGRRRTLLAFQTVAWHELALVVLGGGVALATWNQPNRTGLWTFAILWAMRQSAKLNVFLGVRNLSEEFLPHHLKYLQTYFKRARMNALFPVAVGVSTWLAVRVWQSALATGNSAFDATSLTFAATLLSLAILEHWFLVLPLPSAAMWSWGLRSRELPGSERLDARPS